MGPAPGRTCDVFSLFKGRGIPLVVDTGRRHAQRLFRPPGITKSEGYKFSKVVELWPHRFLSEIWGAKSGEEHRRYKNEGDPLRTALQ